jgi:two-component system, NtrC family, response regulator AtoC
MEQMRRATIMVVEDEIVLALELEEKLSDMGYLVVARATSGEEALEKAEQLRPDLILMDIRLDGDLDGIEVARLIGARYHFPVVYLTAYADEKTLQRATLTEPFGYLVKPYSERELRITVEMALHKAVMERQLRESEERFRTIFESAEDFVFLKDRSLAYTHVNPAMARFLGISGAEAVGKTDKELFSAEEFEYSKELEERVLGGQVLETEQKITIRGHGATCDFVRVPLRDASGRITGLCGIGRDVTERRELERDIQPGDEWIVLDRYPSPATKSTLRQVRLAAKVDSICLFLGESGSGKDYLARYLHDVSPRAKGPFFAINCAALAPELAESELFGHEKGAFTGAVSRKRGLLELAEGGTLLLNEIGELTPKLQSKLLTFLDTKSLTRVGAEKNIRVNARLVAATNRNLEQEVEAGNFRSDLYYRLSVVTIHVPPLRERKEDLPLIVGILVESLARRFGYRQIPAVDAEAVRVLTGYNWPGNIRELRNVLERALIHSDGRRITAAQIALDGAVATHDDSSLSLKVRLGKDVSLPEAVNRAKRALVSECLLRSGGSIKDSARMLGVTRDALNYLLRSLEMRRD